MESHGTGRLGERIARTYLEERGFQIVATNYHCRTGELDIVAHDRDSLIFVEVKCRRGAAGLEQAVSPKKIRSLHNAALAFMRRTGSEGQNYRFMVIYVILPREGSVPPTIKCVMDPF